jgi:hypothetical protein
MPHRIMVNNNIALEEAVEKKYNDKLLEALDKKKRIMIERRVESTATLPR